MENMVADKNPTPTPMPKLKGPLLHARLEAEAIEHCYNAAPRSVHIEFVGGSHLSVAPDQEVNVVTGDLDWSEDHQEAA
jgi:hypothetical protein